MYDALRKYNKESKRSSYPLSKDPGIWHLGRRLFLVHIFYFIIYFWSYINSLQIFSMCVFFKEKYNNDIVKFQNSKLYVGCWHWNVRHINWMNRLSTIFQNFSSRDLCYADWKAASQGNGGTWRPRGESSVCFFLIFIFLSFGSKSRTGKGLGLPMETLNKRILLISGDFQIYLDTNTVPITYCHVALGKSTYIFLNLFYF